MGHAEPPMAFNKSKAIESALKFLNQGKVPQAIGEYQQILKYDPKDQATLMTIGDLFARQGDLHQAAIAFERLAKVYLDDGFNSKAIAIYKKIAKLAPSELEPLEHLADLYVQQGVLSEARPLFLQLAEAHLKANQAPKAVEVLRRLIEIEPENSRVQMRLAELYNVMGLKAESAEAYLGSAQRLFERGETAEALKFIDRGLEVAPDNAAALLLKATILMAAEKHEQAAAILARHPEADAGGEVTSLLVEAEVKSGHFENAADLGRKQLATGRNQSALLFRVAESLLEAGQAREALPLLRELCDPMIEAGEQDNFLKALSGATEKLPGDPEPLEMLADFCGRTSDPFHLNAAQSQLVDSYAAAGNYTRAEELLQGLIERNKDDDRLVQRLEGLRARQSGAEAPEAAHEPFTVANLMPVSREPSAPAGSSNEPLDEETEAYIAQALTDVDLFSSYGLTQKAINLLENVLQRAPRHTPTLERLLDFYLGASNDRRTAELASQLEQIHRERDDATNAERFAELRQRYQDAAGLTTADMPAAPPAPAAEMETPPAVEAVFATSTISQQARVEQAEPPPADAPAEFEIPLAPAQPEPAAAAPPIAPAKPLAAPVPAKPEPTPLPASEEVDLSDEWEAMTQETAEEPEPAPEFPVAAPPPTAPVSVPESKPAEEEEDLVLELSPASNTAKGKSGPATTEEFLSDLAAEIEDMQAPETPAVIPAAAKPPAPKAKAPAKPAAPAAPPPRPASQPAVNDGTGGMNELADVFEQFRSELDIMNEEAEEDLETHYNLGVAYREMGLLDEAIGEFQKVSKAVQQGKPFPYAMNCAALLALAFMDKGEPKVASVWYQRALETPDLDEEAILALRYDLGAALDLAGEPSLALDNFRQVYAMNIDYRDVADRIATLQKR